MSGRNGVLVAPLVRLSISMSKLDLSHSSRSSFAPVVSVSVDISICVFFSDLVRSQGCLIGAWIESHSTPVCIYASTAASVKM